MRKLNDYRNNGMQRLIIGVFIIAVGVLALLDNLGLFDTRRILSFWPTVFIILGTLHLSRTRRITGVFYGGLMLAIGALLTLQNLGYLVIHWRDWWPVFIILAGISYLLKGMATRNNAKDSSATQYTQYTKGGYLNVSTSNADSIGIDAVMSGHKTSNASTNFTGGEISTIMGSAEIDLRNASIQSEAVIELYVVMGSVEIWVPNDWTVVSNAMPVLGGIEDHSVPPINQTKRLVLSGLVVMGGVEIKN